MGRLRLGAGLTVAIGCLAAAGAAAFGAAAPAAHSSAARGPAAARGLDVLPFPGTPDAAPGTNIDFPAASTAQVQRVTVVGSHSGLHRGRLSAQPAGDGSAFSPSRPFRPGEHVSVTATFRSAAAGTASGAPGRKRITFSFSVARTGPPAGSDNPGAGGPPSQSDPRAASSGPLTHTFVTEPGFRAPIVTMSGRDTDTKAGDIFLDAQNSGQNAAYMLSPRGDLLWYQPTGSKSQFVRNVRVQSYHGQPVLTYWQGRAVSPPSAGRGVDYMLNEHYQLIHRVRPGNGYRRQGADSHDFVLGHERSKATAFITIFFPTQANLTSIGGPPNGPVYDWIVQEVDIATGKVLWEWHALGHVPVADSYAHYAPGIRYDYFHLNSIQQLPDGNILISSRNTWSVYLIDKKTGKILWTLGGKQSSFKMEHRTHFEWQHDATLLKHGRLTLFDDAAAPREARQSRALELHISKTKHRVTLLHAFKHSPPVLATSQGSVQRLSNHNVFVGWGTAPYFSEYTPSGKQLFDGSFRGTVATQRAYRFNDWIGHPLQQPALAVRSSNTAGQYLVYASWNGATQVAKWQVLASSDEAGPFAKLGRPASWSGFETMIERPRASYFKVEALDSRGDVLGTSAAVAAPS